MTYLLDDPSPRVRLALAESLASSPDSPRAIIMSLAEDQAEIACTVISCSPVLSETDLVDLAGRSDSLTRGLIAARPSLGRSVAAAIAEIGDEGEVVILLENESACVARVSLMRISERFGHHGQIRNLLLEREDLPSDARAVLVRHVTSALADCSLVRSVVAPSRIDQALREAGEAAFVRIADTAAIRELPGLVDRLRRDGCLTPAFLIHALCAGRVELFAAAIMSLSGLSDRRVRSILATGRMHSVRALFESAGLRRDIAMVFVEAVFLWRRADGSAESVLTLLVENLRRSAPELPGASDLLEVIERLQRREARLNARCYRDETSIAA